MTPKIGIVIGSTRPQRFGEKPARWIAGIASQRTDLAFELIDLRDYKLPLFDEPFSPAWGAIENEVQQRWAAKLDSLDGFILVTPEYNHGPSAVLKNALDYAAKEFIRKPVAFVGYGGVGGARAVEQLRLVATELQMVSVRNAVHIGGGEFMALWQQGKSFEEFPHLAQTAVPMLDELAWWAKVLKHARATAV
ncbi:MULTISPECIES: NAD(P)H-dependent oxidoreductase [Rhodomicrobium]|uniref:NADPH-dependent FMN reductase n=1 Tax=Rhodomicrobium TaxID=1068 RepID=UPI000B4B1651|nr:MULTISPECIES: NAD(P)H-dependent oxidoreductase [Rhodomicrobium]